MSKAILYTRISTGGQEQGTSLASQFAACHSKAAQIGARVLASFEDVQSGADYSERVGLQNALEMLESGEADTLIIYDMSRYSRDLEHQQIIKKRISRCGAQLVFCTQDIGDLDNPDAHLSFGVSGVFAEHQRLKTRQLTIRGKRARAEQNVQPMRSFSPFGYRIVNKNDVIEGLYKKADLGHYVIIEDQAKWVREMYERYADGGSLRAVCRWLTLDGPPAPRNGREWCESTVKRILNNPVYKGKATYGKRIRIVDERRVARGLSKYTHRMARPDEIISIDAPPLVSEALWDRVQEKFSENRHLYSGHNARRWMLSGLMRCPVCGGAMGGRYSGGKEAYSGGAGKKPQNFYYRCRNRTLPLDPGRRCTSSQIPARAIEATVIKEILKYAAQPERLAKYWESQYRKTKAPAQSAKTLQQQLSVLRAREETIINGQIRALEAGAKSEVYETRLRELCKEREALESKIESARVSESQIGPPAIGQRAAQIAALLIPISEAINAPEATEIEKREVLAKIIQAIVPRGPDGLKADIIFRNPLGPFIPVGRCATDASIQMLSNDEPTMPAIRAASENNENG